MTTDELKYVENKLRDDFKDKLKHLNVDGSNRIECIQTIKEYGILWHLTHQLLKAENEENKNITVESVQATGLKMTGR